MVSVFFVRLNAALPEIAQDTLPPKIFFLQTRPGDPPDSIFRKEFTGKSAKYFQAWKSQEEIQKYGSFLFRNIKYLSYKNRIHSIQVHLEYSEMNTSIQDLLKFHYGEPVKPDLYRPFMYWYTPDYFISYEDDILADKIEIRIVSLSVQAQFEKDHPEEME